MTALRGLAIALLCAGCQNATAPVAEPPHYESAPTKLHRPSAEPREIRDRMERIQRELRRLQFLTEPEAQRGMESGE